uniref:Immunoglobulin V-set domain-containing protein n=1 Tax=Astyanax mexicanus TaxID=7994 RepID=A0A8B9L2W0_ASTMX
MCFSNFFTGTAKVDDVIQPTAVWEYAGKSATISCKQNKGASYNQMYWFRQKPGEPMKLIPEFINKTALSGSGDKNAKLTIKSLTSNDSAVYFWAISIKFQLA